MQTCNPFKAPSSRSEYQNMNHTGKDGLNIIDNLWNSIHCCHMLPPFVWPRHHWQLAQAAALLSLSPKWVESSLSCVVTSWMTYKICQVVHLWTPENTEWFRIRRRLTSITSTWVANDTSILLYTLHITQWQFVISPNLRNLNGTGFLQAKTRRSFMEYTTHRRRLPCHANAVATKRM